MQRLCSVHGSTMRVLAHAAAMLLVSTSICDAFAGIPSIRPPGSAVGSTKSGNINGVVSAARQQVRSVKVDVKAEQGPSGAAALKSWDPSSQQAFIQPAVHNKNPVRVGAILAASALAARGSLLGPNSLAKFFHMVSFAAWMGSTLWVTFIAGITMFRNMPRQAFGKVQAKLFPAYFLLHFCSIAAIFIIRGCPLRGRPSTTLLFSLFSTFLNMVILEPRSTDIMMKRYKLEDEKKKDSDEYKSLGAQFGKYHGSSSLVNLVALLGAFVYAWDLAVMMPIV